MALKVFVRKIGEKKSVVAIVAPEGAAPERTMESLLTTLLSDRDANWARLTLAMLVVIAARNTGNGARYHMVYESFPVKVRALVRDAYECAKYTILNSTRDSIILGSRHAVRKSTRALVEYVDNSSNVQTPRMKQRTPSGGAEKKREPKQAPKRAGSGSSSSSSSSSSSGTDSSSDSSSESESEAPSTTARSSTATSGLCRARVRVCREPLAAEWICYACPSGALMCAECVKVHAVWEKTRDHVPVALLR